MTDLLVGLLIGALMFGAPLYSLLIVTKGHLRFFDSRKYKAVRI